MIARLLMMAAIGLAGCETADDREQRAREAWEARQAAYHERCIEYGFQVSTDGYANCRQNFDALEAQNRAVTRGVVLQHLLAR